MSEDICQKCHRVKSECTCPKGLEVHVQVSGREEIEKLQKQLNDETSEIGSIKKFMKDTLKKYGVETTENATFNELKAQIEAEQAKRDTEKLENEKNARKGTPSGGAAGKAPLSSEPTHGDLYKTKTYDSYGEMMEDIEERCNSEDKAVREEAQVIKTMLEEKLHKKSFEVEFEKGFSMNEFWEKISDEIRKKEKQKEGAKL